MGGSQDIFALGLGLEEPWELLDQQLDTDRQPHELHLRVGARRGARFPCPECGRLCKAHDFKEMTWRHLNGLYPLLPAGDHPQEDRRQAGPSLLVRPHRPTTEPTKGGPDWRGRPFFVLQSKRFSSDFFAPVFGPITPPNPRCGAEQPRGLRGCS